MKLKSKDAALRALEWHDDVFADIIRGLLLKKGFQIHPGELSDWIATTSVGMNHGVRSQTRDIAKCWCEKNKKLAIIGLENQSDVDVCMPLREYVYNGADYRLQLAKAQSDSHQSESKDPVRFVPVVTVVIYVGLHYKWNVPKKLSDAIEIPEKIRPDILSDSRLIILNVAWLEPKEIREFKSDFRLVAEMCRQLRLTGHYRPRKNQKIKHPYEFALVWYAFTNDPKIGEYFTPEIKSETRMCEFLDSIEAKGFKKGKKAGLAEGKKTGKKAGLAEGKKVGLAEGKKVGLAEGKKVGLAEGKNEIKLVAAYLKLLGKLEELPEIIENRRRYSYYLGKARKVIV